MLYPEIKDWSTPHNELRHNRHKSLADLIFFSPFMYKFMNIGLYCYIILIMLIFMLFFNNTTLRVILGAFALWVLYKGVKEYRMLRGTDMNMYDRFLKD